MEKAISDLTDGGGISAIISEAKLNFTSYGIRSDKLSYSLRLSLKK